MAKRAGWIIVCVVAGVVCYLLPWTDHSTAGFTMNGFDLAEWSSLHPAVRSSSPAMLTRFLLRAPLVALAAVLALGAQALPHARLRWLVWCGAAGLVLRMIPPAEFFTGETGDPNFRQMLLLSVVGFGLVAAAIPLRALPDGVRRGWVAALWAAGCRGGAGLSRAWTCSTISDRRHSWGRDHRLCGCVPLAAARLWPSRRAGIIKGRLTDVNRLVLQRMLRSPSGMPGEYLFISLSMSRWRRRS